jgi:hypothetical protein
MILFFSRILSNKLNQIIHFPGIREGSPAFARLMFPLIPHQGSFVAFITCTQQYFRIVKNSLKSDYPPPEEVSLTPILALHREFFNSHTPFGQSPARTLPRPEDAGFKY